MRTTLLSAVLFAAITATTVPAQTTTVLATGLINPIRLAFTPAGDLLVAENDKTPNSGRISIVSRKGVRRTLIDGLPSGLAAPNLDPDGVTGFVVQGRTIFILLGEGDVLRNGTKQGTNIVNPDGVSSGLFSSILKMTLSTAVDTFSGSLTLKPENQTALLDGNTVTLRGGAGDEAMLEVLVNFPDTLPDPNTVFRNAHTFGAATISSIPDTLFVIDAGMNTVIRVNTTTGRARTVTRFPPLKSNVPGPPFSDAVPDSIHDYGDSLLITQLTGFPFTPGVSRAVLVNPQTGDSSVFIANLSSAIDTAVRKTNGRTQFWVLEFSGNLGSATPVPGRLTRYDGEAGQVAVGDLVTPTSMVLDPVTGDIFISELATGLIKQYKIQ
ncbi:MAG: ScyD/ScyE family protein [Bryobacteraceae bacterium]